MGKGRGGYPGFGGGMPNMKQLQQLQKQAMKMQHDMEETQASLEDESVTAAAGGGVIEVTVSGKKRVTAVKIDKEVVDPDDVETLQDLVMAATNSALEQIDSISEQRMSQITNGLGGLGGLF